MFDIKKLLEPDNLSEALNMLTENPNLKILAGGTDILIRLQHGAIENAELISLHKLNDIRGIELLADGTISIGSLTTFSEVFRNDLINKTIPVLAEAAVSMGGPQIRNVATIGGNICNGAVSADSAPSLFCLNAKVCVKSLKEERIVPISDFYEGPGKVRINHDEILTKILIAKADYENLTGKYIKFSNRKAMDIALVSVAVVGKKDLSQLRIALGVAAPTPIRCYEAEGYAQGKNVTIGLIKEVSKLAVRAAKARDSWRGSKMYREHLIEVLTERAIKSVTGGNYE